MAGNGDSTVAIVLDKILGDPLRALSLFSGCVAIVLFGAWIAKFLLFTTGPPVTVEDGAITIGDFEDRYGTVVFPLSATQMWADTGIDVEEGDLFRVQVSGAVNMAMHRVVEAGKFDAHPPMPWLSHPGQGHGRRPRDNYALRARTYREAPYGSLLALVCCAGQVCPLPTDPANLRAIRKDREKRIDVVVDGSRIGDGGRLRASCSGRVYLTLNENAPLDAHEYVGTVEEHAADLENAVRKMIAGEVPRQAVKTGIVDEWLIDAVQWVKASPFDLGTPPVPDRDRCGASILPGEVGAEVEWPVKSLEKKFLLNAEDCCMEEEVKSTKFSEAIGTHTAQEISTLLLPLYSAGSLRVGPVEPTEKRYECLASLRRVSDYMRWTHVVKDYPGVWYDDNAGFFWVTMQRE